MFAKRRGYSSASRMTELTTFLFGLTLLVVTISGLPTGVFSPESNLFHHRLPYGATPAGQAIRSL